MSPLIDHLNQFGDRPAVHCAGVTLTYRELADRVAGAATEFGTGRGIVLIEVHNDTATLVHYLGALAAGQVPLPVPPGRDHSDLVECYRPDVIIDADGVHHRGHQGHRLHPELALLLSTSGSTGSPKLVRLSAANLLTNAAAIGEYLDIRETDCAATTLPMSYCYGLSVVHSHLLRGAALLLTDLSVTDDEFWALFRRHRATTFAGVPYTFDLLERIGFDDMDLPDLRYVTQAGGRMAPHRVRDIAALGRRRGWELFVMYGATEATARMAYLPPHLATRRPGAIGRAIPGGQLAVDAPDGEVGELTYRGPNVMLGYAHDAGDLALGRTVEVLRTGDLARHLGDGLYEVVGRASRMVKMFGLRIDLQRLEGTLRDRGIIALCTADDDTLVVATLGDPDRARDAVATGTGVPAGAVRAVRVDELPVLPSGKPDYPAVRALAPPPPAAQSVRGLFGEVLHLDPASIDPGASFVDLGGNSLTYVAMSVRLQKLIGRLPRQWQRIPLRDLEDGPPPAGRGTVLETSVALRALAIVLIVGSHAELFTLWGGAHILLGVAGYNFGRFCLTPVSRGDRVRHLGQTIGAIAVPAIAWVAIALLITDDYHGTNLLLANKFLGPADSMTAGRLWFVEVLVWVLVGLTALCWLADRAERRYPFAFAATFLAVGLVLRFEFPGRDAWFSMLAFWFFAAGWAAAKATSVWQRLAVTVVLAAGLHGYFGTTGREVLVFTGLALLIWLPAVRCPARLAVIAGAIAEASLYTYLTHFQVYALFGEHRLLGVLAAIAAGVLLSRLIGWIRKRIRQSRSANSPSWTSVAAMVPSARSRLAVITLRPRAAAGEDDSSRFHSSARTD